MTQRGHAKAAARRATTPDPAARPCVYCMDGTPSERLAGKGLSPRMCRAHRERLARHGHAQKPSWRAAEVAPFIRLAERTIRATLAGKPKSSLSSDWAVRATVDAYKGMIGRAGPSLRSLPRSPGERSRAILGRLRNKYLETLASTDQQACRGGVRRISLEDLAIKVAAVVAGLELAHAFDPAPADTRYLNVQVGKAVHRLAGGYHRTYAFPGQDAREGTLVLESNRYDPSRGQAVRHLGQMLRERDLVMADHRAALVGLAESALPAEVIGNWTDQRGGSGASKKGGRRRRPYKRLEERGHDRIRLTGL